MLSQVFPGDSLRGRKLGEIYKNVNRNNRGEILLNYLEVD